MVKVKPSEITPEPLYLSRRKFMVGLGAVIGSALLSACRSQPSPLSAAAAPEAPGEELTPYKAITHYNNYYEFSTDKEAVAQ